tara:strand:+ start:5159 stop:5482 length:324 start_codon:yes stop_codon:yes gene_type:complete
MTILPFYLIVFFGLLSSSNYLNAQEPPALTNTCRACHGANGISPNDAWPNIAGQKKTYLKLQLQAFRDGKRHNPLMSPVSQMLSDQDIEALANYYSNLDPHADEEEP